MKKYKVSVSLSDNTTVTSSSYIPVPTLLSELNNDIGATPKYRHNIIIQKADTLCISFSIITTSSTALTYSTVLQAIGENGFTSVNYCTVANGQWTASNSTNLVIGVYAATGLVVGTPPNYTKLGIKYIVLATTSNGTMTINSTVSYSNTTFSLGSTYTVYDKVETI